MLFSDSDEEKDKTEKHKMFSKPKIVWGGRRYKLNLFGTTRKPPSYLKVAYGKQNYSTLLKQYPTIEQDSPPLEY